MNVNEVTAKFYGEGLPYTLLARCWWCSVSYMPMPGHNEPLPDGWREWMFMEGARKRFRFMCPDCAKTEIPE